MDEGFCLCDLLEAGLQAPGRYLVDCRNWLVHSEHLDMGLPVSVLPMWALRYWKEQMAADFQHLSRLSDLSLINQ